MEEPPFEPRYSSTIPWVKISVVVALLVLFVPMFIPHVSGPGPGARERGEAKNGVVMCLTALRNYKLEYASLPPGDHVGIIATLRGANPNHIVFLELAAKKFTARGEYLDPWGTPYRFDLSDPAMPRVWSCGKDRQDNDGAKGSDDIVPWS